MAHHDRAWRRGRPSLTQGDTIFALSSGAPPAAIAIVRVTGPDAFMAAVRLAGRLPAPRVATRRRLRDTAGATLDDALVLVFPAVNSPTGEDLVEFHCHGGRAVIAAVEASLAGMAALRRADRGEFTRRALLNGRIDLAQAEALGDLLVAETEGERIAAIAGVEGAVSGLVASWQARLTALSAQIEASIDYDDESDVGAIAASTDAVGCAVSVIHAEMAAVAAAPTVERMRNGFRVVLAGPRNAGKSTLFNLLAGRDAAIVSPIAGTTRDRIEAPVRRGGVGYLLIDTAGLVDGSDDPIEVEGIARSRAALAMADLVLWLGDDPPNESHMLWVWPRADEAGREITPAGAIMVRRDDPRSVLVLWQAIAGFAGRGHGVVFNERQVDHVERAMSYLTPVDDPLLISENLRLARSTLGGITHFDGIDDVLDAVFSNFCVGK